MAPSVLPPVPGAQPVPAAGRSSCGLIACRSSVSSCGRYSRVLHLALAVSFQIPLCQRCTWAFAHRQQHQHQDSFAQQRRASAGSANAGSMVGEIKRRSAGELGLPERSSPRLARQRCGLRWPRLRRYIRQRAWIDRPATASGERVARHLDPIVRVHADLLTRPMVACTSSYSEQNELNGHALRVPRRYMSHPETSVRCRSADARS